MGVGKWDYDKFPPPDKLREMIEANGQGATAAVLGVPRTTLRSYMQREGIIATRTATPSPGSVEGLVKSVHNYLTKKHRGQRVNVGDIADVLDVSPRRVREALDALRAQGYRIPDEEQGHVILERVAPAANNLHRLMFKGSTVRFGIVSDTHLSSNEQALDELHLAYDRFKTEGIERVLHAGDLSDGLGIYRTQTSEILHHTFEDQVEHAVVNYPERKGITTHLIGGNHDLEGSFGRIGADLVQAVSNRRADLEYLGAYSAWVDVAPEGSEPCWVHLLHGKGGGSYAFSYQAQKLVDSYPGGRKPAILVPGHFHRKGNIEARGVEVVWPGCFQWKSSFMERLGLTPAVGFWVAEATVAEDGSIVRFRPEWFRFFEGRTVS